MTSKMAGGTKFHNHRRRSSVNFRGHDTFAGKICMKINIMPEFYMNLVRKISNTGIFIIFFRKINTIPEFYMIFAKKARVLHNNCLKNISPKF